MAGAGLYPTRYNIRDVAPEPIQCCGLNRAPFVNVNDTDASQRPSRRQHIPGHLDQFQTFDTLATLRKFFTTTGNQLLLPAQLGQPIDQQLRLSLSPAKPASNIYMCNNLFFSRYSDTVRLSESSRE
jgi:hypothetical protein